MYGLLETKRSTAGHHEAAMEGHAPFCFQEKVNESIIGLPYGSTETYIAAIQHSSSRVISATFATKPRNVIFSLQLVCNTMDLIVLPQCYTPTADKIYEETEEFYKQLYHALTESRKKNVTLIMRFQCRNRRRYRM